MRNDQQPFLGVVEELCQRVPRHLEIQPARVPASDVWCPPEQKVAQPARYSGCPGRSPTQHQLPIVLVGSPTDLTLMRRYCSAPIGMSAMRYRFGLQG